MLFRVFTSSPRSEVDSNFPRAESGEGFGLDRPGTWGFLLLEIVAVIPRPTAVSEPHRAAVVVVQGVNCTTQLECRTSHTDCLSSSLVRLHSALCLHYFRLW